MIVVKKKNNWILNFKPGKNFRYFDDYEIKYTSIGLKYHHKCKDCTIEVFISCENYIAKDPYIMNINNLATLRFDV